VPDGDAHRQGYRQRGSWDKSFWHFFFCWSGQKLIIIPIMSADCRLESMQKVGKWNIFNFNIDNVGFFFSLAGPSNPATIQSMGGMVGGIRTKYQYGWDILFRFNAHYQTPLSTLSSLKRTKIKQNLFVRKNQSIIRSRINLFREGRILIANH